MKCLLPLKRHIAYTSFFLFFICLRGLGQGNVNKPQKFQDILTDVYGNELRICAITSEEKDSATFTEYNYCKLKDSSYELKKKDTWNVRHFRSKNAQDTAELYNLIRSGAVINNAVIDELDIKHFAIRSKGQWFVPVQVRMRFVYLKILINPSDSNTGREIDQRPSDTIRDRIIFQKNVLLSGCALESINFTNCTFQQHVSLINNSLVSVIHPEMQFTNSTFQGEFHLISDYASQILAQPRTLFGGRAPSYKKLVDSIGKQTFKLLYASDMGMSSRNPQYSFNNSCVFEGNAFVVNSNPYVTADFSNAIFKDSLFLTRWYSNRSTYNKAWPYPNKTPPESFSDFPQCNIYLNAAKLGSDFFMDNDWFRNFQTMDAQFGKTIHLFNTTLLDSISEGSGFNRAHFSPGLRIIVNSSRFSLSHINVNAASIKDINFPFVSYGKLTAPNSAVMVDNSNSFYNRLVTDARETYAKQSDLASDLANKYRHQQLMNQIAHYRHNPSNWNWARWGWYSFLESTVGNGYQGGEKFFYWCTVVIVLFALVYFMFFRKVIVLWMEEDNQKNPQPSNTLLVYDARSPKNFLKCMWQSFTVFINPKFDIRYFNLDGPLFGFVVLEWTFGIIMVILFLTYIATTYAFVRTLLGV